MKALRLNRQLVLEAPQQVPDGAGGYAKSWVALGTIWGELRPGTGREAPSEEFTLATVTYRITVRGAPVGAPSRPAPDQRLRDGARIFTILAVTEHDAAGHYLTCFAREEVPS